MDAGLEKVIAAETELSKVDGQNGRLIIRGHAVESLASSFSYEDVVHLLWSGFYDNLPPVKELGAKLSQARVRAFHRLEPWAVELARRPSMEGLRLAASMCADGDDLDAAIDSLAALPVATAVAARTRETLALIAPRSGSSHTDDFLYMLTGNVPDQASSTGMQAYFNTVCEHGLNASTFAARVVASTQAGLSSAVIAGLSALKGPLHGGAPGPVLDMIEAIGSEEETQDWVSSSLKRGERVMGFGHRVYKVRDPRADALKNALKAFPKSAGRLQLAEDIERVILATLSKEKPDRVLETNVEYYTAVLLDTLGIAREDFTCVFGCARAAGWLAHAQEQMRTRRIIRPKAIYIGPETSPVPLSA